MSDIGIEEFDDTELEMELIDPVFGTDEQAKRLKGELINWINDELDDLRPTERGEGNERAQMEQDWAEYRRMALARPESRSKDTPWPKSSNMTTPFMFSQINGVAAHVKAALTEKVPRHQVKTANKDYTEHAKAIEKFLNRLADSPHHINLSKYDELIPYELAKLGTQVVETAWTDEREQIKRGAGTGAEVVDVSLYKGPKPRAYRLEDVFVRNQFNTPQEAPMFILRDYYSKQELKVAQAQGFFEDVDKIWSATVDEQDEGRSRERETLGLDADISDSPKKSSLYEILKVYAAFDADEDGVMEDIIVYFEPKTNTIVRSEFNELGQRHRPIRALKHVEVEGHFYGVGVGHMLAPIQAEIDSLHNIRINSLQLSSLQMIVTPSTVQGIGPGESLFPAKRIIEDEPGSVRVLTFPDTSGSTLVAEQVAQQYGQSVTGMSSVQLGMPDTVAKSGTSPTLQQFQSQQGNKVLRSIISNAERGYGQILEDCFLLLVANSSHVLNSPMMDLVDESDQAFVREVLEMRTEEIPINFQFTIRSTEVDETKDAKRQMILTQTQLYNQFVQTATPMYMQLMNPQLPPEMKQFMMEMFVGMRKMAEQSLTLFDVDNADELLPMTEHLELMVQAMRMQTEMQMRVMEQQLEAQRNGNEGRTNATLPDAYRSPLAGPVGVVGDERMGGTPEDVGGEGGATTPDLTSEPPRPIEP